MTIPFIRKIDCVSFPVRDLAAALAFYRDRLGHALIWRTDTAVGLRLPETDAELVLHTQDGRAPAAELYVTSVPEAVERFVAAGGALALGPFEIQIGRCALVRDPWDNTLVLLDDSKGSLRTDADGNVVGRGDHE